MLDKIVRATLLLFFFFLRIHDSSILDGNRQGSDNVFVLVSLDAVNLEDE